MRAAQSTQGEVCAEKVTMRNLAVVIFGLAIAATLDQALNDGHYSEPAVELLHQMARSFGY